MTTTLIISAAAFSLAMILICIATYHLGYSRAMRTILPPEPVIDSIPAPFIPAEVIADIEVIHLSGYLEPITAAITLPTHEPITQEAIEELEDARIAVVRLSHQVEHLSAQVAHKEALRARYLKLLRQERRMMRSFIEQAADGTKLSPYWNRWIHNNIFGADYQWLTFRLSLSKPKIAFTSAYRSLSEQAIERAKWLQGNGANPVGLH